MGPREVLAVRTLASPLESARFGRPVERLTVRGESDPSFAPVRAAILESAADVIVLRYPAERIDWFAKLLTTGRTVLLADSLVYWRLAVGRGRGAPQAPGLRTGELRDPEAAGALVGEIFAGYRNHYGADPLFEAYDLRECYADWTRGPVAAGDCLALYGPGPGEGERRVIGLATVADDGPATEILLAGVVPGERGRNRYAHLLAAVEERASARGGTEVVISTQGHNTGVQRAWARYGFEPVRTLLTVHLVRKGLIPSS
ncbi:GNAT family N-acetyltransferase [Sphaerisporangium sp. NPDC051017]|uniref:GNAT family N-acetyltransferase n=1 Tax=Sphaerisporangium sp. NPDC051017 TaxID=3154636 RepID=UPI003422A6C5